MIDYDRLKQQFSAAQQTWAAADPFPYCTFEGFLELSRAQQIADDFPAVMAKISKPLKRHHDVEQKRGVPDLSLMSETQQQFFDQVLGAEFIAFLEQLTGISPLYPDPDLAGGGLHEIYTGGFLNTHADFNFHPKTGKHRCLNLILYLNADWQEDWHGQLELWSENLDGEPVRVAPTLNTAALFRTTETSWHGHPKPLACPEHVSRRSLAVYYYTDWPEGLEQRAKTTYVLTPDQQQDLRQDLLAGWDQIADADAACRLARRYQPRHVRQTYEALLAEKASTAGSAAASDTDQPG